MMDFDAMLDDSTIRVIGYFSTRNEADDVARVPEWRAKGAEVIELENAPGDEFALIYRTQPINEYCIGGLCVRMTPEQAARWNSGEWTEADDQTAKVGIPDGYEQRSSLRNGEVVMHEPRLTRASEEITMADADRCGLYAEYMEGMPAELIWENV